MTKFKEVTLKANIRNSHFLLNLAYELKVVVLGVSGSRGSHFVSLVVQCKYNLTLPASDDSGRVSTLQTLHSKAHFSVGPVLQFAFK